MSPEGPERSRTRALVVRGQAREMELLLPGALDIAIAEHIMRVGGPIAAAGRLRLSGAEVRRWLDDGGGDRLVLALLEDMASPDDGG